MNQKTWIDLALWELKANTILLILNAIVIFSLILIGNSFQTLIESLLFSKLLLLESGIAFLVGGIIAFSGSVSASKSKELLLKSTEQWSIEKLKAREKVANNYLFLAVIILIVSIIISLLGY